MNLEEAGEGKRYRVTWDDCCAQGSFEAVLLRKNYVPDPPEPEPFLEGLTFANGVTISGHGVALAEAGQVDAKPASTPDVAVTMGVGCGGGSGGRSRGEAVGFGGTNTVTGCGGGGSGGVYPA